MSKRYYGSRRSRPASYNPNTPRTGDRPYVPVSPPNPPEPGTPRPNPTEPLPRGIDDGNIASDGSHRGSTLEKYLSDFTLSGNDHSHFQGVLSELLNGSTDIRQTLAALLGSGQGQFPVERWDMLYQYLLGVMSQADQRAYDKNALQEQRLYDSPQNQLARLMGAGISRDAAIQLLSGGSGSGGSSAALIGSGANPFTTAPTGISGTQELAEKQMKINTVFGAISAISSAIGGLGSFGISAASLSTSLAATRAMTAGQVLSNTQLANTLKGVESASTVIGAISQAVDAGFIDRDKSFDSAQHMLDFIRENAPNFEPFKNLAQSGTLDNLNKDVYALNALNAGYKSWRESRDFNIDRNHIVKMQGLEEMFKSIDIQRVNSEIALNSAKYDECIASVLNSTKLTDSQVALNDALRIQSFAQTSNIDAQTDLLHQQYDLQQMDLDWLSANIEDLNKIRTTQLQLDVAQWDKMDSAQIQKEAESWLKDRQNQRSIIAIESLYYGNHLKAMEDRANPIAGTDQSFADWVVYMHNLFDTALPTSPKGQNQQNNDVLGVLSASKVAKYLLKYAK